MNICGWFMRKLKREVDFSLVAQGDHMKEEEKEEFLSLFKEGGEKHILA